MPKGKVKKFIDKDNSVTFHLVHRSQQDPLITDENAPQRVLVPVDNEKHDKDPAKNNLKQKKKEEQEKYGIFFDDDYDYLQHLKDGNKLSVEWERVDEPSNSNKKKDDKEPPKINLPSSVFASSVEEKVGLLNKAAPVSGPRLDFDPDVVAAMDDDFDYDDPDNQLEDDFMQFANAEGELDEEDEGEYDSDASSGLFDISEEERDEVGSLDGPRYQFKEEETKSRFTEYSMSSSVIRRNENLTLVDEKFERVYEAYDEDQIGALDGEEIEGYVEDNSDYILQVAKDFQKEQEGDVNLLFEYPHKFLIYFLYIHTVSMSEVMKDRVKTIEAYSDSEEELEYVEVDERIRKKWDCESILSTHSTLYNHPKLLEDPKLKRERKIEINKRTGIPKGILGEQPGKLTAKNLARLSLGNEDERNPSAAARSIAETQKSYYSEISTRVKNETSDQRKERHRELKLYRKLRREERKENKLAFKEEKKCQEKILLNNKRNNFTAPNMIHA
ncbi:GSCOCG00003406001-RA-CDS [Cotesia congregata]|nr:GSCOCG00003406001-RA-CDS [Cotesia congregata]